MNQDYFHSPYSNISKEKVGNGAVGLACFDRSVINLILDEYPVRCYYLHVMLRLDQQRLLVIAPHPDDEVIGCGGLIKKIKDEGGKVYVLYMTVGDTKDFSKKGFSSADERLKEINAVVKFLKIDGWDMAFLGNDYHLRLDTLGQKALMDKLERESKVSTEKIKPTMVAFPSPASYNQDHRMVAKAAHASLRPAPQSNRHILETVLIYEEPTDSWALKCGFEPNFFVPLTNDELNAKIAALKLYKSQARPAPNLRSPEILKVFAKFRGGLCGYHYAEGYRNLRIIS